MGGINENPDGNRLPLNPLKINKLRHEVYTMWRGWRQRPELGEVESRQGYLDRPVLYVLVAGILLAAVFLAFVWPALT
jgi:hypothetical protein